MNNDEADFEKLFDEDLPFKPLTKGLGFHHSLKEKKEIHNTLKGRSKDLNKSLHERALYLQSQKTPAVQDVNLGDLAPFYKTEGEKGWDLSLSQDENLDVSAPKIKSASVHARFFAFLLDMIVVLSGLALIFLGTLLASGISLGFVRENLSSSLLISAFPMSVLFYFFYFSFFDKTDFSTPGKKLTGLKVISENGKRVKMSQAFLRAALTLFSLPTFGLVSMLDFQSKLSDTKVIKK